MIFQALYAQAFTSLAQVLTRTERKRTTLLSVSMFIYSLGPSIINLVIPILAQLTWGMTDFKTLSCFSPYFLQSGVLLSLITFKGYKEKIVVPKDLCCQGKIQRGV